MLYLGDNGLAGEAAGKVVETGTAAGNTVGKAAGQTLSNRNTVGKAAGQTQVLKYSGQCSRTNTKYCRKYSGQCRR